MSLVDSGNSFGCDLCFGQDAERLVVERDLADDSHFIVQLRRCADCGQPFVWVFTETIDWVGGEDAQYRHIVPLRADEVDRLDVDSLEALGDGRRRLVTEWPSDEPEKSVGWATGPLILLRSTESR